MGMGRGPRLRPLGVLFERVQRIVQVFRQFRDVPLPDRVGLRLLHRAGIPLGKARLTFPPIRLVFGRERYGPGLGRGFQVPRPVRPLSFSWHLRPGS